MLRQMPAIHDRLLLKMGSLLGERNRVSAPRETLEARQRPRSPVTSSMRDCGMPPSITSRFRGYRPPEESGHTTM